MDELMFLIEETCRKLLAGKDNEFRECFEKTLREMMAIFPKLIVAYSNPTMSDMAQDAVYWPQQLERIIQTADSQDKIALFDVLYSETYMNLIEVNGIMNERKVLI